MAREPEGKGDEGYEFVPPDFDEEAFIHREMVSFRTTVVLFVWGILAGLASWAAFGPAGDRAWLLGLAIMAGMAFGLKPLFAWTKSDISHWRRMQWIGTALLYFFTWLSVFMILVNPPIGDHSEPRAAAYASPAWQVVGGSVLLDVFGTDNAGTPDTAAQLSGPVGDVSVAWTDMGPGHRRATLANATAGIYTLTATARDADGRTHTATTTFRVQERVLSLQTPALDFSGIELRVDTPTGNFTAHAVRLELENSVVNLRLKKGAEGREGIWYATRSHTGWHQGDNNFTVVVEGRNRFHTQHLIPGGTIVEGPFTVRVDRDPADEPKAYAPRPNPTTPPPVDVPGPGAILAIVALLAVASIAARRR